MEANELNRLRAVPLETVLEGFGLRRDCRDPRRNWRGEGHRITVTGDRFFDHSVEAGGGGALDLTLHLMGHDMRRAGASAFREAASWLGASQRVQNVQAPAVTPEVAPAAPPTPTPARLPRVRWYLTDRRGLPRALVDAHIERGRLFADERGNAVFQLRDEAGRPVGYEKRGTADKPFHAVHGDKGLYIAGSARHGTAVFVESAIEALSYVSLHPASLAISTTGNAIERPERVARLLHARGLSIVAAFNADASGERFAERFAQRLGLPVRRDRPGAKDWNDQLVASREWARGEAWTR